ncbi:MAG: mechanosensitive ion channel family protein [Elusimicrobiota bacterium]
MPLFNAFSSVFGPAFRWSFPVILLAIAALFFAAPAGRRRLAAALLMALAAAGGLLVTALLVAFGLPSQGAPYRALYWFSHFLLLISAINASAALAFCLLLPRLRMTPPALLQDISLALAYLLAVFSVLTGAGVNLSGILATSAVITAVIAFSLQDTLGNLIGGMVLHLESSFSPGDRIRFGEVEGVVREVRWRQTAVASPNGDLIFIPNSALMKGTVSVLGRAGESSLRRLTEVPFCSGYQHAPNEIIGAVTETLGEDPPEGVAPEPPPDCVLAELKESCAVYRVRYWLTDLSRRGLVDSAIRARVYYALSRAGIKLSVAAHSVVVTESAEGLQKRREKEEADKRRAALAGVDILRSLTDAELQQLALRLKPTLFAKGETITRQGASADWLYIVSSGEAEVFVGTRTGSATRSVARLKAGDFFGEMGLMTGEPRSATVVALCDAACYRLDRDGFRDILAARPGLAEGISRLLAERKLGLDAARGELKEDAAAGDLAQEQRTLLSTIRVFFGLS